MKLSLSTLAALTATALFSTATAQYTNQSHPFNLIILSQNETINGSALLACHEGAAIEGLCPSFSLHLGPAGASTYTFNTSTFTPDLPAANQSGTLNYLLSGSNFNVSEPMQLSYSPVTNIAVPLFSPSDEYTQVWFDDLGEMNIHGYVDDTQEGGLQFGERSYKRWFVCETYAGYDYVTLAWVVGGMGPENPSCQGVGVVRVFV